MGQSKQSLPGIWKYNVKSNYRFISAILGDILISMIIVLFYVLNFGWNPSLFTFCTLMAVKPYLIMIVSVVSKGEVKRLQIEYNLSQEREKHLREKLVWEQEKNSMISKLNYEREIAEWRVQVAGLTGKPVDSIKATYKWNEANDQIGYLLEKGMKNGYISQKTMDEICDDNEIVRKDNKDKDIDKLIEEVKKNV